MDSLTFTNPRGLTLAAHLWETPGEAAVVLVHGFCSDKASNGRFEVLSAALQEAGIAALAFDLAGCGASEDAMLDAAGMIGDTAAACALLRRQGKTRIALFGNSLGGSICLKAALPGIAAIAASGAATASMPYDWSTHCAAPQLEELEQDGVITEPVESAWRESVTIGAQMLLDFTETARAPALERLACPVLLLYGDDPADAEEQALLALARANLARLPAGSRIETIAGQRHGLRGAWPAAVGRIVPWLARHLQAPT
ncbi:MAG: alpha/beta fold hydrolase [Proteobacteria bacterium]|nr:alpha/beta fold hydrolase [Pseudomonadota bacterium]